MKILRIGVTGFLCWLAVFALSTERAFAQAGSQGAIVVTITDTSGGVVADATLTLVAQQTNDMRTAKAEHNGTYTFVNLPIGTYSLTVEAGGYARKIYDSILVQASQSTAVAATLAVGSTNDTVRVSGETTPVLETSSNEIGTVVDIKQIEDLPLNGRDLTAFSTLVAGYNGTYNGLPSTDQGSNIDGVMGNSARMKFTGNIQPAVSPRLEDIEQMTIQTDQLSLNSGFGQSSTQVNFVSRSGSNQFHGRAYEDFRNSGLNANSWTNDANGLRKNKLIMNDFGGSIGGPILHDKLFFFGTFAMRKIPGSFTATNDIFTSDAQSGVFTYAGTDGQTHTANVLQIAHQYNANLPNTVNAEIASDFATINTATKSGAVTATSNPNFDQIAWLQNSPTTYYYPAARLDFNPTQRARMYLSWLMTEQEQPAVTPADFPGSDFANQIAGNKSKNFTASYGFDFTFSPRLINQFKAGFLYDATFYAYNAAPLYTKQPTVGWNYPGVNTPMSGQAYNLPVSTYYPIFNVSDSMTWQRGRHTIQYGVSWYREQDHYWNAPSGFNNYSLGLAAGDPALNAFTNGGVQSLSARCQQRQPGRGSAALCRADRKDLLRHGLRHVQH